MSNALFLNGSTGLRRRLHLERTTNAYKPWNVALYLDDMSTQAVLAIGDELKLSAYSDHHQVWIDSAAFAVLAHEARQIADHFAIPFPCSPATVEVTPPCPPAFAVAGNPSALT